MSNTFIMSPEVFDSYKKQYYPENNTYTYKNYIVIILDSVLVESLKINILKTENTDMIIKILDENDIKYTFLKQ